MGRKEQRVNVICLVIPNSIGRKTEAKSVVTRDELDVQYLGSVPGRCANHY